MRLCVSVLLILASAQTWTRADAGPDPGPGPGPEECSRLNSPLSLKDKTPVLGRFHFLVGFTNSSLYKTILSHTSSFWFNVTQTQTGLGLTQFNKMNGTCVESKANATVIENTVEVIMQNVTSQFQFVNSSRASMILDIRASAADISSFILKLKLDPRDYSPDLHAHSFYLMSREPEVSEEDLRLFRDHAKCAGYTGEPDYTHQRDQNYCSEEESILTIY